MSAGLLALFLFILLALGFADKNWLNTPDKIWLLGSGEINHIGPGEKSQYRPDENRQSRVASPPAVLFTRPVVGQPVSW